MPARRSSRSRAGPPPRGGAAAGSAPRERRRRRKPRRRRKGGRAARAEGSTFRVQKRTRKRFAVLPLGRPRAVGAVGDGPRPVAPRRSARDVPRGFTRVSTRRRERKRKRVVPRSRAGVDRPRPCGGGAAEAAKETFFSKETSFPDFSGPETFSGPGTRRGAPSDDDASWVRADGQSHGDPPRGLAELYYLLSRSAGTRGARGAGDHGETGVRRVLGRRTETGVSPPPRAPPESVVQDVLRDIFESGSSLSKMTQAGRERTFADDVSEMSRAKEEEGAEEEKKKKKKKRLLFLFLFGEKKTKTKTKTKTRSPCSRTPRGRRRRTVCWRDSRCTRWSSATRARWRRCGAGSSARSDSRTGTGASRCPARGGRVRSRTAAKVSFRRGAPSRRKSRKSR